MNVASERAREACDSCRKSHKKCTYDDSSKRCLRCEKRDTPCSLFEITVVAQQVPTTLAVEGSIPDSWGGASSASSNFTQQFSPVEEYYWATAPFASDRQGEYPANMIFQSPTNQHESEQPAMNQGTLYAESNVFSDRDGT